MRTLLVFLFFSLVFLNIIATVSVMRSGRFDAQQKRWQSALIWLLPLIGAFFVLFFTNDGLDKTAANDQNSTLDTGWVSDGSFSVGDGGGDGGGH